MFRGIVARFFCFFAMVVITVSVFAEDYDETSLSLLYGSNYDLAYSSVDDDKERVVFTFERFAVRDWGDVFFFLDKSRSTSEEHKGEMYSELQPRFSLSNLSGRDISFGIIKDTYLSTQVEFGNADSGGGSFSQTNYLLGLGVDLDVPGVAVLQVNAYRRSNEHFENSEQLTIVWLAPFEIGGVKFLYDGFVDYTSSNSNLPNTFDTQHQVKLDVGHLLAKKPGRVYLGIEWQRWVNKYGVDGVDESVVQALVKVHL